MDTPREVQLMIQCSMITSYQTDTLLLGQSITGNRLTNRIKRLQIIDKGCEVRLNSLFATLLFFLSGFVDVCVQHVPSPKEAAKTKVRVIYF